MSKREHRNPLVTRSFRRHLKEKRPTGRCSSCSYPLELHHATYCLLHLFRHVQRDSPVSDTPAQDLDQLCSGSRCFSLPHCEGTFAKWDRLALDNNVAVRGACFCRPCVFGVVRWKAVERTRARCDVNCARWCLACRVPKRVVKSDWLNNHATTSHNVLTQCRLRHVIIDRYCTEKKLASLLHQKEHQQ